MSIAALARARQSVRAFAPDLIDRAVVESLLSTARAAPSGANLQPGRFIALTGAPLAGLSAAILAAMDAGRPMVSEYGWFPDPMPPDLKARQRATGFALYAAAGIERRDMEGRRAQFRANYCFFDAPVGLVVTLDRRFGPGGFLDLGMVLQTLFLAATDAGLATCGIGALANHADVVAEHLRLPANEMVICGVALGRPATAPINDFRTPRLPPGDFAEFRGWPAQQKAGSEDPA